MAVAVPLVMFAALAVIVAVPGATPVTGTVAVVPFAAMFTETGTVAAAVLLEVRPTVKPPAGAGPDSVTVRFCVPVPVMVVLVGLKLRLAVTATDPVADV